MRRRLPQLTVFRWVGIPLAMFVALAAFPALVGSDYSVFVGNLILFYAVVGLGLGVAYGYAGQFSIGQSGFVAIGAYAATLLTTRGWDFLLALSTGAAVAGLVGATLGFIATRLQGFGLGLVTYGFGVATYTMILTFASITGGLEGLSVPTVRIVGIPLVGTNAIYYVSLGAFGLFAIVNLLVSKSFVGRNMLAIKGDSIVASVLGIPVRSYKVAAFAYSAITASVAGSLFIVISFYIAAPAFDPLTSITYFALVVIGGARSVWGILGGAALAVGTPEVFHATREVSSVMFGVVMVLVLMFAEDGLAGIVSKLVTSGRRAAAGLWPSVRGPRATSRG